MDLGLHLVLPPYLLDRIRDILADDVDLPLDLRQKLADVNERNSASAAVASTRAIVNTPADDTQKSPESEASDKGADANEIDDREVRPPTIETQLVEDLSKWANTDQGRQALQDKGIDYTQYSLISLLAGTEVYIPPKQLALLKAAENPEKPNPYLPSHLSVRPPAFSGYRALSKQLSTILNILFSIIGSGAAVYIAGTTGAGYTRETSVILGVIAGVLVGLAEIILVWILVWRVDEGRKNGVEQWKGSSGEGLKESDGDDEASKEKENEVVVKEKQVEVRLRRRAIKTAGGVGIS